MNTQAVINHIVEWLKAYSDNSKTDGFVVGVSGGIDSAVTSTLVSQTGKPVICLEMPIHQPPKQVTRAQEHIKFLKQNYANVSDHRVDLTPVFENFIASLPSGQDNERKQLSLANSRARLRMTTLYYFAGLHNYLVAGTGNKVEDFGVGFFTKYGDGGVDLSPIADLFKSQVYQLGKALGVNASILNAPPTDGLWTDDRSDEDQIGATYPELEWAMQYDKSSDRQLTLREKQVLEIYSRLHKANKHKMLPIEVCTIPPDLLTEK